MKHNFVSKKYIKFTNFFRNPSTQSIQILLYAVGAGLLTFGFSGGVEAQFGAAGGEITVQHDRIDEMVRAILAFLEGSFGALIMVVAGIFAIVSSAFGQYRVALGLLAMAIGAFILRALVNTFFARPGMEY